MSLSGVQFRGVYPQQLCQNTQRVCDCPVKQYVPEQQESHTARNVLIGVGVLATAASIMKGKAIKTFVGNFFGKKSGVIPQRVNKYGQQISKEILGDGTKKITVLNKNGAKVVRTVKDGQKITTYYDKTGRIARTVSKGNSWKTEVINFPDGRKAKFCYRDGKRTGNLTIFDKNGESLGPAYMYKTPTGQKYCFMYDQRKGKGFKELSFVKDANGKFRNLDNFDRKAIDRFDVMAQLGKRDYCKLTYDPELFTHLMKIVK